MAATALHSKTGALPRPGSSGAPLPGLPAKPDMPDIPEDARKYPPPTRAECPKVVLGEKTPVHVKRAACFPWQSSARPT